MRQFFTTTIFVVTVLFSGTGVALDEDTDDDYTEMVELIDAIEEEREHISSGQVGRNGLEIVMAVFESSRTRRLVNLPLEIQENPLESMMEGE